MNTKKCVSCGQVKPTSEFYAHAGHVLGVSGRCKVCDSKVKKQRYHADKEKHHEQMRASRLRNIEGRRKREREKYRQDHEKILADRRRYYRENKQKVIASVKKWQDANRAKVNGYIRNWFKRNTARATAYDAGKKSRRLKCTPPWLTPIQEAQIQEHYEVAKALTVQTGILHHVDHVVPLQGDTVRGLHVPWNLEPIPHYENVSKGNRWPYAVSGWSAEPTSPSATPAR